MGKLILTRRVGEAVIIGDNINITVLDVTRNQVRLSFSAPPTIPIHRQEIYLKIKAEEGVCLPRLSEHTPLAVRLGLRRANNQQ